MQDLFYFRSMIGVHLKEVQFFAYHGICEGEEKTGSRFEVNLSVWYDSGIPVTEIEQTINYVTLYEIVKQQMQERRGLLETVAESVCSNIYKAYPFIKEIIIEIDKRTPPIENFEGSTGITLRKTY